SLLRHGPQSHAPGDVRRSVLRRQPRLRRLGSDRISRRAHDGQRGRAESAREPSAEAESQIRVRLRVVHEGEMSTRLKETDVVIVGLGAAGGVAALPLAQAGLDVIGLEAGTWLTRKDFEPDELRNNYR